MRRPQAGDATWAWRGPDGRGLVPDIDRLAGIEPGIIRLGAYGAL